MKKLTAALFVGIVLLALAAIALGAGDTKLTSGAPGMSVRGYTGVTLRADGEATVSMIDSGGPTVKATYYLYEGEVRKFSVGGYTDIDSVAVTAFTTATAVVANPF